MKRFLPLLLLFALILNGCGKTGKPAAQVATADVASLVPEATPGPKYGGVSRALIRDFSNIGPRVAGSTAEAQAAQYVSDVFKAIGYTPETQPFTADYQGKSISSANVMAVKKGASAQEVIVGTHYDSTDAGPGADEASGVAAMLEIAQMLAGQTPRYTIRFIAFGAEDSGLMGSYAYLNEMSQEEFENMIAMIDLNDLIAGDVAYVYGDEGQTSLVRDWAVEWANGNGLDLQTIRDVDLTDPKTGMGRSNYAAFRDVGIPYAYFQSTNWGLGSKNGLMQVAQNYGDKGVISGTKYDTLDYLDKTFPGRVDQHLNLFISVVYNLLLQFEVPIS